MRLCWQVRPRRSCWERLLPLTTLPPLPPSRPPPSAVTLPPETFCLPGVLPARVWSCSSLHWNLANWEGCGLQQWGGSLHFSLGTVSVTFAARKPSRCSVARVWAPGARQASSPPLLARRSPATQPQGPQLRSGDGYGAPCFPPERAGRRDRRVCGSQIVMNTDTWEALSPQNRMLSHFEGPHLCKSLGVHQDWVRDKDKGGARIGPTGWPGSFRT